MTTDATRGFRISVIYLAIELNLKKEGNTNSGLILYSDRKFNKSSLT
jgi:hypothetical protein